jgi:hypothetical protein
MLKIAKLFLDFPELKIIEKDIRKVFSSDKPHPFKNVYKRYTLRKPKYFDKAIKIIKESSIHNNEIIWAHMYINYYYWGSALLNYLNLIFSKLKSKSGFNNMLINLMNPEQFFDTISELEFNGYFSGRYVLGLEPKIEYSPNKFKKLDSKIKISNRNIYFEILTPKMTKLLIKSKTAIDLPNRSKNKFLDKLDKQLNPIRNKIKSPLILVVNGSYSDIDEFDIENSLLGENQITLVFNKKSGETVNTYTTRKENSLVDKKPDASCISGVLFYRRYVRPWGIEFRKNIIFNKKADYPLTAKEYKALNRFDLRKINIKTT